MQTIEDKHYVSMVLAMIKKGINKNIICKAVNIDPYEYNRIISSFEGPLNNQASA